MPRFIAFLRAINVGGHNVKMDRLRTLFEALTYTQVETFIASGNVIFESPTSDVRALELEIESHLHKALGYAVTTFIRSPAELKAITHYQPFADAEGHNIHVAFLTASVSSTAQHKLMDSRNAIDDFHVHKHEVYWLRRTQVGASVFSGAVLEKTIGMPATLRNITTVKKLAAKYGEDDVLCH